MRHFDLIDVENPSVIRGHRYIRGIVSAVKKLSREEANATKSYIVGDFITADRDLCIDGFGELIPNRKYPFVFKGTTLVEAPTPLDQEHHVVIRKGTTYVLLNDQEGDFLVETDHAFSEV